SQDKAKMESASASRSTGSRGTATNNRARASTNAIPYLLRCTFHPSILYPSYEQAPGVMPKEGASTAAFHFPDSGRADAGRRQKKKRRFSQPPPSKGVFILSIS